MAVLATPAPRKLPVWSTLRACYGIVARNIGQLVRISWLWLLIMVPVYAATHWLVSTLWAAPGIQTAPQWASEIAIVLPLVVELPFLASIAVAWHRLVLRREHVSTSAYLRLDTSVWLYALCSLGLLALTTAPLLCALAVAGQPLNAPPHLNAAILLLALIALALAAAIFFLPRLSLVLPALALGERLSLWDAWLATRGNTLRLALATCLCMLPALFLVMVLPLLSLLLSEPWLLQPSWGGTNRLNFINQLLDSIGYAVFNSLAYAVLTIFAVTLLSLTYRFFVAGRDESGLLPSP